jgi:maleylpyruvate isomerase
MKLYSFFRSSASYRVRIALSLKGIAYEYAAVNLMTGESHTAAYLGLNPQGIVPTLDDNGRIITQSMAICEYLEEIQPAPPLLPREPADRARVRAIALAVACEIHPVGGGRAQGKIASTFNATAAQRTEWMKYFIETGFGAIEQMIAKSPQTGRFCHGDSPTLADAFLVPQVLNAEIAKTELTRFPTIQRIYTECLRHDAFIRAHPDRQPDAA